MLSIMNSLLRNRRRPHGHRSERGVALILVIVFLSLMLLLGLATTMTSITELNVGRNVRLATEAFDVADAGAIHAHELVRNMRGDFTSLLRGNNNVFKDGDEFAQHPARVYDVSGTEIPQVPVVDMFDTTQVTLIPQTNGRALVRLSPRHFYELVVYDNADDPKSYLSDAFFEDQQDPGDTPTIDCDQRVLIRSIGYVMRNDVASLTAFSLDNVIASAVVDIVIGLTPYPAVISDRDLRVENSSTVGGALGGVHANDDLVLGSGNFTIAQSATYTNSNGDTPPSGANETADNSHVTGFNGYADALFIPPLTPFDFAHRADYIYIHKSTGGATPSQERQALYAKLGPAAVAAAFAAYPGAPNPWSANYYVLQRNAGGTFTLVSSSTAANFTSTIGAGATRVEVVMSNSGGMAVNDVPNWVGVNQGKTLFCLMRQNTADEVSMNGGTSGQMTLLSNGNIKMNGNANLRVSIQVTPPHLPPWDRVDLLALAGQDITLQGTAAGGDLLSGVLFACEQFNMTGNAFLSGQVIAKESRLEWNAATVSYVGSTTTPHWSNTPVGSSVLQGNFTIMLNTSRGFLGNFAIASWRQLRDFNPATDAE